MTASFYLRSHPRDLFLILAFACMALGTFVFIEPAPIDAASMGLLLFGLLLQRLSFSALQIYPGLCISLFLVANIGSMWDPIDQTRAVWYLLVTLYLLCSLFLFCGLINYYGYPAVESLMGGYVLAGIVSAFLGCAAYFGLIPGQAILLVNSRPKGLFKDPNVFGPYLVPMAIYAIANFEDRARTFWNRAGWATVSLIAASAIFLSYSRACWINFAVAVFAYTSLRLAFSNSAKEFSARLKLLTVLIVALVAMLGSVLMIPEVHEMVELRLGSHGLQSYDQLRFYTHHLAWDSIFDRPFGIGPGQAETAFQYATHSTYLRILSENGIVGAFAFFLLFALSIGRGLYLSWKVRDPRWQPLFVLVTATLLGVAINSIVIDTNHWRHIWLFVAIPWVNPQWIRVPTKQQVRAAIQPLVYGHATTGQTAPWPTRSP